MVWRCPHIREDDMTIGAALRGVEFHFDMLRVEAGHLEIEYCGRDFRNAVFLVSQVSVLFFSVYAAWSVPISAIFGVPLALLCIVVLPGTIRDLTRVVHIQLTPTEGRIDVSLLFRKKHVTNKGNILHDVRIVEKGSGKLTKLYSVFLVLGVGEEIEIEIHNSLVLEECTVLKDQVLKCMGVRPEHSA